MSLPAYRDRARRWLAEHAPAFTGISRQGLSFDEDVALGRRWQAAKAAAGYAGITIPTAYGGAGGSEIEKAIFAEEEMAYDLPTAYFSISLGMPIPVLLRYATEEQKLRFIPPALRGEQIWCQLFSEPAAGSDLAALRLSARRDGSGWRLDGQKLWTSWAQLSDYGVVVARSDPTQPKHAGLTYFFLDMRSPGVTVRPVKLLTGGEDVNEVFFDDVFVPDAQRLGEIGNGFRVALETLMIERYAVTDPAGYGPRLAEFVALAARTRIRDHAAIEDGAVREAIAKAFVDQHGLKIIRERAMAALSQGVEPGPEGAIQKLVAARGRQQLSALALDLQGEAGAAMQPDARIREDFAASWLDSPTLRIAGGTDEMLRNTIAERVLGLPQDHRPDKGLAFNQDPR